MSLPDRLSNLSSTGGGGGTEQRRDSDASDVSGSAAERQLVQRCVIIQKDERGYGLTVSGDNPVYVASVKPEGAAAKAGVQKDDRIVKVNGTLVLNRNHIDVVKLIRSGSYVALTLMGKPNLNDGSQHPVSPHPADVNNTSSNRNSRITNPQPVDPDIDRSLVLQKVHMTRVMLEQAREDFLYQQRQYVKTPSEKLHTQLLEKERTVKTLENQLRALTVGEDPSVGSSSSGTQGHKRLVDVDQNSQDPSLNWAASLPVSPDVSIKPQSPHNSPRVSPTPLHPHNARHDLDDSAQSTRPESAMEVDSGIAHSETTSIASTQQEIITIDDEDVNSEEEEVQVVVDTGPFSDMRLLEKKPAHLAVFLHYLISNSDPSALLFSLVTDMYKQTAGNTKDLRKWGYEIFSTFLVPTAPLRVGVKDNLVSRVGELLTAGSGRSENELMLRSMFDGCRAALGPELNDQLVEFRNMRAMGLGSIFGAHELLEKMDKNQEMKMVEKYLVPHLHHCSLTSEDVLNRKLSDKDLAMGWALATYLRQVGLSKTSSSGLLERVQSFIMKDKRSFKLGSRSAKAKAVKGHQFNLQHFYSPTLCSKCEGLIWGVGYQGFLCQSCEIGVHKQCVEDVVETCTGKKRGKRTAVPFSSKPRLSVSSTGGGDTGSQVMASGEARSPPHTSGDAGGVFSIQPVLKEDEMELANVGQEVSVRSIVKNFQDLASPTDPASGEEAGGGDGRKGSVDLNRSESLKGKGDKSERPARRAKSDVDRDDMMHAIGIQSGSSSASSLSNRSGESPSHSSEHVNESIAARAAQYDSDLEVEELPPLKQVLGEEIHRLKLKEKKRQEVINELFHTEKAHLRNLKVLDLLFNRPMRGESGVMPDLAHALFPNMDEIIMHHASMNRAMKERRSQSLVVGNVGDILLDRFDGDQGDRFRKACAEYCRNQSFTLERLKHYRRKEQRLAQFLAETEADKLCRKLELKDHVPCQMQRLTKYPMLIENLLKYTKTSSPEHKNLEKALESSKHILAYVNQAVRECQNYHKLKDMQKKLETRAIDANADPNLLEIKNLDLTQHKLVFEGPLVWRLRSHRLIDLQVVLLEDILVLLQRADDRLVLKCQSTNLLLQSIGSDFKYTHSPVLKLQNLLARDVATDKKAFFVINTSDTGPQIYELVAQTQDARKTWCRLVNEKAEERKKLISNARKMPRVMESPSEPDEMFRVRQRIMGNSQASSPSQAEEAPAVAPAAPSSNHDRVDNLRSVATADCQPPLVQPDQVSVSGAVTVEAQAVLTPIERLRRIDQVLEQALSEKKGIVAEILHINPRDFPRRGQGVGGGSSSSQRTENSSDNNSNNDNNEQRLIMACMDNMSRLIQLISGQASSFALTSQQQGSAESGSGPGSVSGGLSGQTASVASSDNGSAGSSQLRQSQAQLAQGAVSQSVNVPMPVSTLQSMAVEMNQILSTLMSVLEVKEAERHTLRSQLEGAQKQLDMLKNVQQQILAQQPPCGGATPQSRPLSFISVTSSISEAGEGEGTDGEQTEDDSGSVLNVAQTQELTQDLMGEEAVVEETVTDLPQLAAVPNTATASATAPQEEESDEEPYSMIPENLPLPDDNCLQTSAPFPPDMALGEERGEGSATTTPPADRAGLHREASLEGGGEGEPMTTDLDEGVEDVLTTPTPSPVSPELLEGGEQDDRDSVRTVEEEEEEEEEDSDEGAPDPSSAQPRDNTDSAEVVEDGGADPRPHPGQDPALSSDHDDGVHKGGDDSQHGENNNRTCPDSELTTPIEI